MASSCLSMSLHVKEMKLPRLNRTEAHEGIDDVLLELDAASKQAV